MLLMFLKGLKTVRITLPTQNWRVRPQQMDSGEYDRNQKHANTF